MKYHANAKLTRRARRELAEHMQACGPRTTSRTRNESSATVYKWWRRWRAESDAGLWDRIRTAASLARPRIQASWR